LHAAVEDGDTERPRKARGQETLKRIEQGDIMEQEEKENHMKVAYVFSTSGHTASYKLGAMILPQLEQRRHGAEVVGMFFFDDNTYVLRRGDSLGERLGAVAREQGILLMLCDQCATERGLATRDEAGGYRPVGTVEGVRVGCFPDLYAALATNPPDQVITL
jgi:sulfur relay (sulfurtransferase) complex TusBCD TusD component (DsrE family)